MHQAPIHRIQDTHAPIVATTITLLIGAIGRMVFLITMLLEEEEVIKAVIAKGIQEEKETNSAYIVVSLTTLSMSVTGNIAIHLARSFIILKVQTSTMSML